MRWLTGRPHRAPLEEVSIMSDEKKQDKSLIPNASLDRVRVYSGAQPSPDSMHLGSYIGAVNNWGCPTGTR